MRCAPILCHNARSKVLWKYSGLPELQGDSIMPSPIERGMTGIPTRADEVSPSGDEPVFSLGLPGGESSSHPGAVAAPQSLPYTSLPDGSRLYETGYTGIY